jgi:hypothetical protein
MIVKNAIYRARINRLRPKAGARAAKRPQKIPMILFEFLPSIKIPYLPRCGIGGICFRGGGIGYDLEEILGGVQMIRPLFLPFFLLHRIVLLMES